MASSSSQNNNAKRTRLQEDTEKRRLDEKLKEKTESKRQKKMFAQKKMIGPRDILVNSNLPKIKLEQDVGGGTPVKQETLKLQSTFKKEFSEHSELMDQQENSDDEIDVKHNMFSSAPEQDNDLPDGVPEADQIQLSHNFTDNVDPDEPEVRVLKELIEKLELRLHNLDVYLSRAELGKDQMKGNGSLSYLGSLPLRPSVDDKQVVANLSGDKQGKDLKIEVLSQKVLELRYKIFEKLPERHLKKVLPILYIEFNLKDTYDNRSACSNWKTATNMFVADLKYIPTWNIPPLQILARTYKFCDLSELINYNKKANGRISSSTVWLDNISLETRKSLKALKAFFAAYGNKIKYFKIRQCIDLKLHYMDAKAEQLMDFVKFCLERLPNLEGFTFVISHGEDKSKGSNYWKYALQKKTEENEYWQGYTFPKLENLESLLIDFENFPTFLFLKDFASSLIDSYSNQLKQLRLLTSESCLWNIESLVAPNLTQLTIRQSLLAQIEFNCKSVEKCTILDHADVLKHDDLILIEAVFPKVVCLGFKFEYWRAGLHESLWTTSTPKLPNVVTLELENCRSVTFTVLSCFPNLRYLKLKRIPINTPTESQDNDTVLCIRQLFQKENLYKKRLFWEHFPHISLVTLEIAESQGISFEPEKALAPKLYTYTRKGYEKYWGKIFHD